MLQALGGSHSIAALWEGRQWEEAAPDSVCPGEQRELGNALSLYTTDPQLLLMQAACYRK